MCQNPMHPAPQSPKLKQALLQPNVKETDCKTSGLPLLPTCTEESPKRMEEYFAVNAIKGVAALQVKLPLLPSHNDFTPELSLFYSSDSGNSPFGQGWQLKLPGILRISGSQPEAQNDEIFRLGDCGDLAPRFYQHANGDWMPDESIKSIAVPPGKGIAPEQCLVKGYRLCLNGRYQCIEHIRSQSKGSWWRTVTQDNIVTWYGLTAAARITDPANCTFEWLPQLITDGMGNIQHFVYKPENSDNLPERVRGHSGAHSKGCVNLYLKNIRYGNLKPFINADSRAPQLPDRISDFLNELVFDYGEHYENGASLATVPVYAPALTWACRDDPFTDYSSGFELHTRRRCKRVLLFRRTPLRASPSIAHSIEFSYKADGLGKTSLSLLTAITCRDYSAKGTSAGILPATSPDAMAMEYEHYTNRSVNKSHLLAGYRNGAGKTVCIVYKSADAYHRENAAGDPSRPTEQLCSQPCVSFISTIDAFRNTERSTSYSYHHACYDGQGSRLQGFGRVETFDTCGPSDIVGHEPYTCRPYTTTLTKTWYHNGAWLPESAPQDKFAGEYNQHPDLPAPATQFIFDFNAGTHGLASLMLKADAALCGYVLRQEVYTLEDAVIKDMPDTTVISNYKLSLVQPFLNAASKACFRIRQCYRLYGTRYKQPEML